MYGSYIRAARERAGLTPSDMARALGYADVSSIAKIERDAANISLQQLDKMAEIMGVRIGDLLPNSGAGPANDLCAPILAAMVGLDPPTAKELLSALAEQARIMASWRRRDTESFAAGATIRTPRDGLNGTFHHASVTKSKQTDEPGTAVQTSGTTIGDGTTGEPQQRRHGTAKTTKTRKQSADNTR